MAVSEDPAVPAAAQVAGKTPKAREDGGKGKTGRQMQTDRWTYKRKETAGFGGVGDNGQGVQDPNGAGLRPKPRARWREAKAEVAAAIADPVVSKTRVVPSNSP